MAVSPAREQRRALPVARLADVADHVLVVALATCSSLDNIDVAASGQATIPMRTVLDELLGGVSFLGFEGFDISQSQEFQNQGYSKDQIDSVRVEQCVPRRVEIPVSDQTRLGRRNARQRMIPVQILRHNYRTIWTQVLSKRFNHIAVAIINPVDHHCAVQVQ